MCWLPVGPGRQTRIAVAFWSRPTSWPSDGASHRSAPRWRWRDRRGGDVSHPDGAAVRSGAQMHVHGTCPALIAAACHAWVHHLGRTSRTSPPWCPHLRDGPQPPARPQATRRAGWAPGIRRPGGGSGRLIVRPDHMRLGRTCVMTFGAGERGRVRTLNPTNLSDHGGHGRCSDNVGVQRRQPRQGPVICAPWSVRGHQLTPPLGAVCRHGARRRARLGAQGRPAD